MDFFEKAHVVKKDSSRKDNKSEEAVKKQLKQMLYGYKQSDSKLLKTCADKLDPNQFVDDSSSVSGFSDLNLTNSSNEVDTTTGTLGSEGYETSDIEEESNIVDTSSLSVGNLSISDSINNLEPILEHDESINNQKEVADSGTSDNLSSIGSIDSTTSEMESNLSDDEFDADRALAMKILDKMDKKFAVSKPKKAKKRKSETLPDVNTSPKKNIPSLKCTKQIKETETQNMKSKKDKEKIIKDLSESTSSSNDSNSSDFVSVKATDMPNQSLNELLGEYRYSTVKNLPSEVDNAQSYNNCGIFTTEDMNVEDILIQEEVDSLTLEVDDDLTLEDVDIDSTEIVDLDTSLEPVTDSASVYDNTLQTEETSEKEMSIELDSTFNQSIKVFYGHNCCILVLQHPAQLYIHGKVKIKALGGTLELLGYTLQGNAYEVYAPNYNYAQCLKTVEKENVYYGLFSKIRAEGLTVSDTEDIVTSLGEYDCVVSLSKLNSYKMDFVENNMLSTDLFSKPGKNIDKCFHKAFEFLGCSLYLGTPWKAFVELPSWRQTVDYGLTTRSRGLICGGKGVGKSTFMRYCVNRLLSQGPVLVVDLDPGQAEFTVAGNISATIVDTPLLGPNFTHLKTPNMMLNIGMINTMDNPRRYAAAVGTLIAYCNNNEHFKTMPWIINTMGMCNAIGLKFIALAILHAQPTYLMQIDSKNPKKRFEYYLNSHAVRKLYQEDYLNDPLFKNVNCSDDLDYAFFLSSHMDNPVKNSSLAPRDERYLNYLAYFGELLKAQYEGSLLGITPYEVRLEDLNIAVNVKISVDAALRVINGKIIALCQLTSLDKNSKVFTLKDKPLVCHGHGLIRGVDFEKQMLYLITPIPAEKLSLVNTIVYADWVPELRGQERHLPEGTPVPYRTATMYQKRQLMFAPKRRFNPLQLIKMSRSS